MLRRITAAAASAALLVSVAASTVAAGGPPGLSFYVDGDQYRTVGTPTDFFGTGAPASTFDKIYNISSDANGDQLFDSDGTPIVNVAESKPGDRDFNGGRWMVLQVTWNVDPEQLTSAEAVEAAALAGDLSIDPSPVKEFLCPVIPANGH